jgi:hypothetical protein
MPAAPERHRRIVAAFRRAVPNARPLMRRIALGTAATALVASMASAQPAPRPRDPSEPGPLGDAMVLGVTDMLGARLSRFGDMTTEDFLRERAAPAASEFGAAASTADDGLPSPWTSCSMEGPVRLVDLNTGTMIPLQVALASRGARSVALVTLGRPLRGRQGFSFPASRWVEWEGEVPTVSDAPGFAPDASVVLREHDAAVLSYERGERDIAGPTDRAIVLTRVGPDGRVLFPPHSIAGTRAMDIDAVPVSWPGGTAVVFGESVATAPGLSPARRETLWFLDGGGRSVRPPLELTHEARDDGRGAPSAGLAATSDGLVAAWTVADGAAAGVWTRGVSLGTARNTIAGNLAPAPGDSARSVRVLAGPGYWGPAVSPWGVTARRSAPARGAEGGLVEVLVLPAAASRTSHASSTGTLWDPLVAWTPNGALVLAERASTTDTVPGVVSLGGLSPRGGSRWFADLGAPAADPADVIDLAITPTDRGAIVAWIAADPGADAVRRRLALARIGCRVEPARRSAQGVGAHAP